LVSDGAQPRSFSPSPWRPWATRSTHTKAEIEKRRRRFLLYWAGILIVSMAAAYAAALPGVPDLLLCRQDTAADVVAAVVDVLATDARQLMPPYVRGLQYLDHRR
jgi:hypothetical protein